MRTANLHDGKVLEFADETPDDVIDAAVKSHMEKSVKKKQEEEENHKKSMAAADEKHTQIVNALYGVAQLLHNITEKLESGHSQIHETLKEHGKHLSKKRRMKAIRDEKGKISGSEEY